MISSKDLVILFNDLSNTVVNGLEDQDILNKVNSLISDSGISLSSQSASIPNPETLGRMFSQLIEVATNLGDTPISSWPSGSKHLLIRALEGIMSLYSGIS